ncbi:hypothetical protein [Sodalis ligni]|uniref:Uncharacterized protein n=1 Tax=Sodalis ligni TaxID=2697027 RepID=A0A4R1N4R6_9GAMM|nr:hypothetical protein [Sodalis ligni]TCL02174.1 hypothetical protein EZJ58_0170 [Sodalis ligni]
MSVPARTWILRLFSHRIILALVGLLLVIGTVLSIHFSGDRIVDYIADGERWLWAYSGYFFVWRLFLYTATTTGWRWLRTRLRQQDPSKELSQRIRRIEIFTVIAVILLESQYSLS